MGSKNLALVVGSYDTEAAASDDYDALRSGQDSGGYEIVGAVVLSRSEDGKVRVKEHGDKSVGHGAAWGAGAGAVLGLFAPPLLAATAVGAGVGAILGKIRKSHEEKQFGVDVDEYLAPGTSAVVAVVGLGLACAPVYPLLVLTTGERTSPEAADRVVGFQAGASSLGSAIIPGLVGLAVQQDPGAFAPAVAVLVGAGAVLLLYVRRRRSLP